MSALRSPRNLTRELLEPVQRLDASKRRTLVRAKRQTARKSRSSIGNAPRLPTAIMSEVEAQMLAITGSVNVALLAAVRPLLRGDGPVAPEEIRKAIQRVRFSVPTASTPQAKRLAAQNLERLDHFNRRDVQRAIGVAVPEYSAAIGEKWRREHVAIIKSISEESKARFTGILRDASKKQTRVETIKGLLEEQLGINDRRARLLARDQVLTLNAKLNEDRQKRAGVTEYIWRTLGDGSVRGNHSHLNGKRFKYADPPIGGGTNEGDRGNPGSGIGCRCQAIPVIPEFE